TIKDRTHNVTARGTINGPHEDIAGNDKLGLELETVVDRREFGLEWNAPLPGVLKTALDWVSRPIASTPLIGKPAAVIGASTGLFGAVWAQAETRKVLSTIGARVVDREIPIPQADESLGTDGLPLDDDARELLEATLTELIELAHDERVA